jgi:hypothetical protein
MLKVLLFSFLDFKITLIKFLGRQMEYPLSFQFERKYNICIVN